MNEAHPHPWESAKDQFEATTLSKLKLIGLQIGKDASAGNEQAKSVIRLYEMLRRSFDPITAMRLDEAIASYEQP